MHVMYLILFNVEIPEPPRNFTITPLEDNDLPILLNWTAPIESDVEEYVLEWSVNGGEFYLVRQAHCFLLRCRYAYTYSEISLLPILFFWDSLIKSYPD